jgi:hypothetical protein
MFVYISKAYIHQKYLHTELNLNKVSKYIWIQMKYKTENQNRKRKTERLTRPGHFNPAPAHEPDQLAHTTAQPNLLFHVISTHGRGSSSTSRPFKLLGGSTSFACHAKMRVTTFWHL